MATKKLNKTLTIPAVNQKGEDMARYPLDPLIFGVEGSEITLAQTARSYLDNQRKSRAKAKHRSEVNGSGAKIWRQKGTGRARHSTRKAPIFVGGGVAHGPTGEQNYHKNVPKKMAQKAVKLLLSDKVREQKIILVRELDFKKTKEAFDFLGKVRTKFKAPGTLGLLTCREEILRRSFSNIKEVSWVDTRSLNPYFLLKTHFLLVTSSAIKDLEKKFTNSNNIKSKTDEG